jgi:hypothetical protein
MARYGDYVSYDDLVAYTNADADGSVTIGADKKEALRRFATLSSRMFDGTCRRVFYPRSETRYYDYPPNPCVLKLDDDLLEVTAFTTQNGGETVASTDYYLMCGGSYNYTPYNRIVMRDDQDYPVLLYTSSLQKSQALLGIWGYHEDWSNAWEDSQDALAQAISSTTATTVNVADADGADLLGMTPRFKIGQLIKVGSEYMYVTAVTAASTNQLTVIRGVNGTTAATHDASTAIYIYRPMGEIMQAATRLAAWLYAQRDAPFNKIIQAMPGGTRIEIPMGAPDDVHAVAAMYVRSG